MWYIFTQKTGDDLEIYHYKSKLAAAEKLYQLFFENFWATSYDLDSDSDVESYEHSSDYDEVAQDKRKNKFLEKIFNNYNTEDEMISRILKLFDVMISSQDDGQITKQENGDRVYSCTIEGDKIYWGIKQFKILDSNPYV